MDDPDHPGVFKLLPNPSPEAADRHHEGSRGRALSRDVVERVVWEVVPVLAETTC
ncbi:hypothetical protein [Polyangium mundeleinium]|uniref:Uncharacterized protein n=1 Tax=Polyangium mundeleinium TaxID=2995306 RepID=A0ABT5F6E7_9BACT|nr:hypothetical protein [Polyangium mundeleinium]MDC0748661.1 hypothetical protein [Polyangium mundeleinium]